MFFYDKVMHSRHSTATSGLNQQQNILLANINGINFYGLYTRWKQKKKKSEIFQKMTRLFGFCIFKMCAAKGSCSDEKIIYSSTHEKGSRFIWQTASKVFRTWLTVTHCFIWKCNTDKTGLMGWEHQHQHQWQRNSFRSTQNTGCVWIWYYWDISNALWKKIKLKLKDIVMWSFFFF